MERFVMRCLFDRPCHVSAGCEGSPAERVDYLQRDNIGGKQCEV